LLLLDLSVSVDCISMGEVVIIVTQRVIDVRLNSSHVYYITRTLLSQIPIKLRLIVMIPLRSLLLRAK
jgi:hypothetical protein